jgi:hypothetical protein
MSVLFTTGDKKEGVRTPEGGGASSPLDGGLRREGARDVGAWGGTGRLKNVRLPFDKVGAQRKPVTVYVTSNALVSADVFQRHFSALLEHFDMTDQLDNRKAAVYNGLLLYYAVNGSSVLAPRRAEVVIEGMAGPIDIAGAAISLWGADFRRVARYLADEILRVVRELFESEAYGDDAHLEMVNAIKHRATVCGLARYPYLAFDVADHCTVLSVGEHALVREVKNKLLANTDNVADVVHVDAMEQAAAVQPARRGGRTSSNPAASSGFAY